MQSRDGLSLPQCPGLKDQLLRLSAGWSLMCLAPVGIQWGDEQGLLVRYPPVAPPRAWALRKASASGEVTHVSIFDQVAEATQYREELGSWWCGTVG